MYIEIGSRQSGKTARMVQNILYQVTMIKNIKIIIISGNMAMQYRIKERLRDLFDRTNELREIFNKNLVFASFEKIYNEYIDGHNELTLNILLRNTKNYMVYCDEFLYAKNAHNFLFDQIKYVEGFKDKLYLTASPDLNGKHKEIFKQFIELNNNEYINIGYKFLKDLEI